MKAVKYPLDPYERTALKSRYVTVLSSLQNQKGESKLRVAQKEWQKIRKRLPQGSRFPSDIRKILKAEYPKLVAYFRHYMSIGSAINNADKEKLKKLFSYDEYHDAIADFFVDGKNGFNLSVCHYCGTAYINKYTVKGDADGLDTINNADLVKLEKLLKIHTKETLRYIDGKKPFLSVAQFNNVGCFRTRDKFHSIFPAIKDKNHFDLDHVLDKGHCPITAISLMNFVPSCSVCNEKLKRQKVLGRGSVPIEELSPTSQHFDFDRQVSFRLNPIPGRKIGNRPTSHEEDYTLEMDVRNPDYDIFIEMFHLRERYAFHKIAALFWLELKYRYTDSRIALMANSIHDPSFSAKRIKDDVFQRVLDQRERSFEKLKRDILK